MIDRSKYLYRKKVGGHDYLYFRGQAGKLTRLPPDQSSTDFRRAYDECMRAMTPTVARPRREAPSAETLNAAIEIYLGSPEYKKLKPNSRRNYAHCADQLRETQGPGRLADLDIDAIDMHTALIAGDHGGSTADMHIFLLSSIWKVCKKYPQFKIKGKPNPTLDAERRYKVERRHRAWSPELQDKFMDAAPKHLQLAKLLLHFSAQRGGDCVKMKWSDFDGRGLQVRPEKAGGETDAQPNYHLCPKPLRDALLRAPRTAETILVNSLGRPWANASTLSKTIRRQLVEIGAVKKGQRGPTMHGLRKTAASDVGSLGVGAAGIKSVGGWRSDAMANYYAQDAERRRVNERVVAQWDAEIERQNRRAEAAAKRAEFKVIE